MKFFAALSALIPAAAVIAVTAASAQVYPSRAVTVTIPYAAGGTTDVTGRITMEEISKNLGVPMVMENRVGGGPILGTTTVAQAASDGYNLLFADNAPIVLLPNMKANLPYDPWRDFTPVAVVSNIPLIFVANPKAPFKTLSELIALAKANPSTIRYGSGGTGTSQHMTGLLLESSAGIKLIHVPYRGGSLSTQDAVAGHIEMAITSTSSANQFIEKGMLVPFATATTGRVPALPNVPTVNEQGFKNFDSMSWFGIFAPKNTPREVIVRLQAAAMSLKTSSEYTRRLAVLGATPSIIVGDELTKFLADDDARIKPIIKNANLRID